jgi:DNA-binding NtrC family response regulator
MTQYRVLLVDDEELFLTALAQRMAKRGYDVATAENGSVALELAAARNFHVIVLDLAMPGIDGIETLKKLRAVDPDLQIILLTGHATVSAGVEAMKLGAMDFLQKPADFKDLLAKIEEAGARRASLTQQRAEEAVSNIVGKKGW